MGRFVAIALFFVPGVFGRSVWFADNGFAVLGVIALLTAYGAWASFTPYPRAASVAGTA